MCDDRDDFIGYIKEWNGKFRPIIGGLRDVDVNKLDGDQIVWAIADSGLFGILDEAIAELRKNCDLLWINKVCIVPIHHKERELLESQFQKLGYDNEL